MAYPYITLSKIVDFAILNNIKTIKLSTYNSIVDLANISNKNKAKKIYQEIPEKLGFKKKGNFYVYSGDLTQLKQNIEKLKQEDLQPKQQPTLSKRQVKQLDTEQVQENLNNILGNRANLVQVSDNLSNIMRQLNNLLKNNKITKNEFRLLSGILPKLTIASIEEMMVKIGEYVNTFKLSKRAQMESGDKEKGKEVLIDKDGVKLTRGDIFRHYSKPDIRKKIMSQIKGDTILIYLGTGKNKNILKRNHNNKPIVITNDSPNNSDDPNNYFYWVKRRLLSIHKVFGKKTNLGFVDLDLHNYPLNKAKQYANKLAKELKSKMNVSPTIMNSGGEGLHIEFKLNKEKNIDDLRKELKDLLDEFNKDYPDVSTGVIKRSGMRSDISTLHNKGSIRVMGSLGETYGKEKKPLNKTKKAFVLSKRAEFEFEVMEPLTNIVDIDENPQEKDTRNMRGTPFPEENETKEVDTAKNVPEIKGGKSAPKPVGPWLEDVIESVDWGEEDLEKVLKELEANFKYSSLAKYKKKKFQ